MNKFRDWVVEQYEAAKNLPSFTTGISVQKHIWEQILNKYDQVMKEQID